MISMFYVTCTNKDEAERIALKLLEEKLIACANIIDKMSSIYIWQDKIENSQEAILLVKTSTNLADKVKKSVRDMNQYSCPCIIELGLKSINKEYEDWINACVTTSQSN